MISINDVSCLAKLKKMQDILRDDAKYNLVSHNLYTSKEARNLFYSFSNRIIEYYAYFGILKDGMHRLHRFTNFRILVSPKKKLGENDFLLYDDFENFGINAWLLVYSPFSINFFCKSLKSILNKYFTGIPIPNDDDELNGIVSQIGKNLSENMQYCPPYLKRLLQEGYNSDQQKIEPTEFFPKSIINMIFKNPYLLGILDFPQKITADKNDLNRLQNSIISKFKIEGCFDNQPLTSIPHELKLPPIPSESSFSPMIILNFIDLLIKGKTIPDHISSELSHMPFLDQIQELLVTKNDSQQTKLFEKLKDSFKKGEQIQSFLMDGLKTIEFEIRLNELSNMINQTTFNLKCNLITYENSTTQNIDYKVYINDPNLFLKDVANIYGNGDLTFDEILAQTCIKNGITDPIFLMTFMLKGLTLDEFLDKRPNIKIENTSFYNELENSIDFEEEKFDPLIQMKETDIDTFNRIASVYSSAFSSQIDPYNMLRGISKAYTFALNLMKMFMNPDVCDIDKIEMSDEDEEKFIISLLYLVRPPNVFSTFIYLYEFFLSPVYSESILDETINSHLYVADKLFNTMVYIDKEELENLCMLHD